MNIGQRMKLRRKELKISADAVADKLGVNRATIFRYENGEIGVFAVNGGVTMKRFRKNDDVRLESLNKKYEDIVIQETDDFNILGKVIL